MPPVEASATADSSTPAAIAAAPCVLAASSMPALAGRGVRAAGVGEDRAQRSSRQRSWLTSTGAAGVPERGEARRADRVLGVAYEQPEVAVAAGLDPASHPGRAEARGQAGVRAEVAYVRRRGHPAGVEEWPRRSGGGPVAEDVFARAHSSPSVSGNPNITLRFCTACEDVPFQRLSIAESTITLPAVRVDLREHAAEVRRLHVARARRRAHHLDERLLGVGGEEQLGQLAVPDRARRRHVAVGELALVERDEVRPGTAPQARRSRRPRRAAATAAPRSPACGGVRPPCRAGCSRPRVSRASSRRTCVPPPRGPAWRRSRRRRSARRARAARGRAARPSDSSPGLRRSRRSRSARGAARSGRRRPAGADPDAGARRTNARRLRARRA